MKNNMEEYVKKIIRQTDLYPWFWLSYGEKCYAFAVVSAFQVDSKLPMPKYGSELEPHEEQPGVWVGENGTEMMVDQWIAEVEEQNGAAICSFIAAAHAYFLGAEMDAVYKKEVGHDV